MFAALAETATKTELLAALSALGAVIVYLWNNLTAKHRESEKLALKKWEECEISHKETTNTLMNVVQEMGEVRGKLELLTNDTLMRLRNDKHDGGTGQPSVDPGDNLSGSGSGGEVGAELPKDPDRAED